MKCHQITIKIGCTLLMLLLLSCNNKEQKFRFYQIETILDTKLKSYIDSYIIQYNIKAPCLINIEVLPYSYNYTAFNISTEFFRDYQFTSNCYIRRDEIKVCFYSRMENYMKAEDNRILNVSDGCLNAGLLLLTDSSGVYKSFSNVHLFLDCELPDTQELNNYEKIDSND